jgi:hypothetical protein
MDKAAATRLAATRREPFEHLGDVARRCMSTLLRCRRARDTRSFGRSVHTMRFVVALAGPEACAATTCGDRRRARGERSHLRGPGWRSAKEWDIVPQSSHRPTLDRPAQRERSLCMHTNFRRAGPGAATARVNHGAIVRAPMTTLPRVWRHTSTRNQADLTAAPANCLSLSR